MAGLYPDVTAVGVGGGGNLFATNELPVDMHSKMLSAFPSLNALTVLLTRTSDNPAHNFRIDWQEKEEMPTTLVVATTEASAGVTVVVVDNADTLVADTLLFNPRTFDLRLFSSTSGNSMTVVISQGGTTSAVWKSGDVLHVLPPALAENDETFRAKSVADSNVFNYEQLCKLQFGITRVADKLSTHFGGAGSKRDQLKSQKFREYATKKEKLIIMGGRATGGTAPATKRMAGGLVHYLRNGTLYKDFNGIFTESGFRNYVGDYKDQNPDATEVFYAAAGNVIGLITDFGLDKVRVSPRSKEFGLNIFTYISRGITVNLLPLPLLDVPVTRGWGFLLDMERIMLKTLDRDTFFPDAKTVGESEIIYDTYRGVYSILLANESRHAMSVGALL